MKNRYGGGFPQCRCRDKACLVYTVAAISEMATITDNPQNNTRHVVITVKLYHFHFVLIHYH
ncbi:hypothetical protein JWG39_15280 [Desulforhopalus vacuolatus]|uniref:hypothetical protein n=1 Tax=Desulforhopalus vacuolatus TaxID=40414 RepID=UPI001965283A|nr:hypothetical protein [Desulforhopalus vacuolatus]MBM9521182.1 hypothetical protein [Desulforhopalus vacuolatus]